MGENLIGIDVGTTSVKASVFAPDGTVLESFSQSYPTDRADMRVEQDPSHWTRLIDAALAQFDGHGIAALGLCSQVNTHVFVGADGQALMPAIQWQDARASDIAAELDAQVSEAQKIEWWGAPMPIDASHAMSRMVWVARHRPEIWDKTRYVMLPKDFCMFHLTGVPSTDPLSNIGLVGPDMGYVPGVFDLLPGSAEKMAPLVDATEVAGAVDRGRFKGTPVSSGTMDAWAGLVGAGAGREGRTVYLSGTSEIVGISSQTVTPTPGAIVFPPCSGVRCMRAPPTLAAMRSFGSARSRVSRLARSHRWWPTPRALPRRRSFCPSWKASVRPCGTPICVQPS